MTDLEENCWSESCCQTCGSTLQEERYPLNEGDTSKAYCSRLCFDSAVQALKLSGTPLINSMQAPAHGPDP
jgi:hypothetical protein